MDYYAEYHMNRHSIYKLQYHLVVVTKYRHPVLTGIQLWWFSRTAVRLPVLQR